MPRPAKPKPDPTERQQVVFLARQYTQAALDMLWKIAQDGKNESARVTALTHLLDRGWGRAPTAQETKEKLPTTHIQVLFDNDRPLLGGEAKSLGYDKVIDDAGSES